MCDELFEVQKVYLAKVMQIQADFYSFTHY